MKSARWLLLLVCFEGLLAFLWTFFTPSESGSAVFLWFSRLRILLVMAVFVLWVLVLSATIWVWRSGDRSGLAFASVDKWFIDAGHLPSLILALFVVPLIIAVGVAKVAFTPLEYSVYQSWAPETFPLLHSLVTSALPIILFVLLMAVEIAIYLSIQYRHTVFSPGAWTSARVGTAAAIILISLVTVFHWIIFAFQLRIFASNPAWYWKIERVPFTTGDVCFILGALGLFALAWWLLIVQRRSILGLGFVFVLGVFLQIGPGIISGSGLATVAERYFTTYHKTYVEKAGSSQLPILETVRQYETLYGSHAFTDTKPPGLMGFYIGLDHLINGYPSSYSNDIRYGRLSNVITFSFPVLAVLMVFVIYLFVRWLLQDASGFVSLAAPLLYVLCPNLVLFSLFPDQAIYPFIFLLGVWLIITIIRRQSFILAFLLGLFLYVAVFFAFTMLPLYVFAGIFLLLDKWLNVQPRTWNKQLGLAFAIGLGTLILYILFLYALNYNFLPRFEKTMAINHAFDFYLRVGHSPPSTPETLMTRIQQIVGAAWLNNLDFAAGIGFPIYFLFLIQAARLLGRLFKRIADSGDTIPLTFLLSFIVLNLAGTAQGEVPRLWLFWLPMVVILAAYEIRILAQKHRVLVLGLVLAEFITILLTYHFQDLRM